MPGLPYATKAWTTPVADDTSTRSSRYAQGGTALSMQANEQAETRSREQWRTPTTKEVEHGPMKPEFRAARGQTVGLQDQVSGWPTPAARDRRGANSEAHFTEDRPGAMHMDQMPNAVVHGFPYSPPDPSTPDGEPSSEERRTLNPRFVEWLMGWPIGWTDCEQAETGLSAWLERSRGALSTLLSPPPPKQGDLFG
jgi:hypothetical protein